MAPAFFANETIAGVNVIAQPKSRLQIQNFSAPPRTHFGQIWPQEDGGGGMRRDADQDLSEAQDASPDGILRAMAKGWDSQF